MIEHVRSKSNIVVELQSEVQAVHGDTHLTAIDILDRASGTVRRRDCGGLFVFIGADAETSGCRPRSRAMARISADRRGRREGRRWSRDRDPYLLETSVPGIFACGDVRSSPVKRVASAVGEGSMAIAFVHQYLQHDSAARNPSG
jgi:thioredoxin reductase (NADPH)